MGWCYLFPYRVACPSPLQVAQVAEVQCVTCAYCVGQCLLMESLLSDALTVSLDYAGAVVAVSLSPTTSTCEHHPVNTAELRNFHTHVQFKHIEQGPM